MLAGTHRFIIKHALQFRRKHFRGYEDVIERACTAEDIPRLSLDRDEFQVFGFDHFYNPKMKSGYSKFSSNAKDKGMQLFKKAFRLYKKGDYREAFRNLGRSCHYLQDLASPSHTKLILHMEEDDFERYVDQNIHKLKFRVRAKVVPPILPVLCFETVARRSYRVRYEKNNYFLGILFRQIFRTKQKDPEKKLDRVSKKLVKMSIIYTIALLNAFNRRIVRYNWEQKPKEIFDKIKGEEKKIVGKIKKESRKLVHK